MYKEKEEIYSGLIKKNKKILTNVLNFSVVIEHFFLRTHLPFFTKHL